MEDHKINKPTIFISHASTDAEFTNAIKHELEKVFANGLSVFCTSSPGVLPPGVDWLQEIERTLQEAQAVIAIVTPVSIERPWLWFEIGAAWGRGRSQECRIYPLCAPEVNLDELPAPLDRLQALSMGKAADLKLLFQSLITQFDFGKISSFRASNITSRIPKYSKVRIKEVDLHDHVLYSGKYTGYTDEELMEVIDTGLFAPDERKRVKLGLSYDTREDLVHNGKLLHFKQIDRSLDLPPGTAKRLVKSVAERYKLIPSYENENIVRFRDNRFPGAQR